MSNKSTITKGLFKLTTGGLLLFLSTTFLAPRKAHAEALWEPLAIDNNSSKEAEDVPSVIWDSVPQHEQNKPSMNPLVWEVIPDNEQTNPSLNQLIWQVITDDEVSPEPPAEASRKPFDQQLDQLTPEKVEALLNNIP